MAARAEHAGETLLEQCVLRKPHARVRPAPPAHRIHILGSHQSAASPAPVCGMVSSPEPPRGRLHSQAARWPDATHLHRPGRAQTPHQTRWCRAMPSMRVWAGLPLAVLLTLATTAQHASAAQRYVASSGTPTHTPALTFATITASGHRGICHRPPSTCGPWRLTHRWQCRSV